MVLLDRLVDAISSLCICSSTRAQCFYILFAHVSLGAGVTENKLLSSCTLRVKARLLPMIASTNSLRN